MSGSLLGLCWCGQQEVFITTQMLRRGETDACGRPSCRPGCVFVDPPEADGTATESGVWELVWAPGMCLCGCGEATAGKSRYRIGHDQKLKREIKTRQPKIIRLIDPDTSAEQNNDAVEWLASLSTPRFDWASLLVT